MKNLLKISITTLGFLAILGTSTFAVTTGIVNAPSGLVLREEASKTGNPITTLPDKTTVNIVEDNGEWYKVTYDAHEGYIFAEYVEAKQDDENVVAEIPTTEQQPIAEQQNNTQITGKLKIYNMPLITSTVIGELEQNVEITVLKQITNWSYVSTGEFQGWARTYAVEGGIQTENTTNSNQPDTNLEGTVNEPTVEENTDIVETPEIPTNTPSNTEQIEQASTVTKGFIAVDSATVRKAATTSSEVVTYLIKGTSFEIQAETEEWYKIKYTDIDDVVYEGYIYKELVTT